MEIEKKPKFPPIFLFLSSPMTILLVLILLPLLSSSVSVAAPAQSFAPQDNYLIDCGAKSAATVPDGRAFKTEDQTGQFVKAKDDILVSIPSTDGVANPIYLSARIFKEEATYTFDMNRPGFYWVRLHFYPFQNNEFDLLQATFSVNTDKYIPLHNFKVNDDKTKGILKEFLLKITHQKFSITFTPMKNSAAFINAIEVVSASDSLITDEGTALSPVNSFFGLTNFGY